MDIPHRAAAHRSKRPGKGYDDAEAMLVPRGWRASHLRRANNGKEKEKEKDKHR
jgi:hypothetical protein